MDFASEWAAKNFNQRKSELETLIASPHNPGLPDYLRIVEAADNWGVYASNGPNFKFAVFGRDSLVVADDLVGTHKDLVADIILVLAKLQGVTTNDDNEEEPGKIHHEFRQREYSGIVIPDYSLGILNNLQKLWGNEGFDSMVYYGSYDSTPLYVRLVCKYVEYYGDNILNVSYVGRDNQRRTIKDSLKFAVGWIVYKLNESPMGLLEYKRINPHGIENQSWKDSRTGYLRRDGSMPNFNKGVASIEIQGYVYDALVLAAKYVSQNDEQSSYWLSLASEISDKVLGWFWMDDEHFFAQGLDYDENDKRQQLDTITSNGALILNSQIIKDIRPIERDFFIEKIAEMIFSEQFITDSGIRSRALKHESIPGFIDYHGTYTIWHKETNEVAKGLRNYGLNGLAGELEKRIISSVLKSGEFDEFLYVDVNSTVWYDKLEAIHYFSFRSPGGNLPIPEPGQAWTISAVYRIILSDKLNKEIELTDFEKSVIGRVNPRS